MADVSALVWVLVLVIVIEGVWLAGITYLIWRSHRTKAKRRKPQGPSRLLRGPDSQRIRPWRAEGLSPRRSERWDPAVSPGVPGRRDESPPVSYGPRPEGGAARGPNVESSAANASVRFFCIPSPWAWTNVFSPWA